jgi:REP element-mobilizing transposase RayT
MADLPKRRHLHRIPVWLPLHSPVVYFVTACCLNRRHIFVSDDAVRVAIECLRRCEGGHGWMVSQVCLMPDHVHLLVAPAREREQSLAPFVQAWKSCVTLRLRRGAIWQAEFFDHLLRSEESAEQKWEYIRMNPVCAGLCSRPEDYAWSGTPGEILRRVGE